MEQMHLKFSSPSQSKEFSHQFWKYFTDYAQPPMLFISLTTPQSSQARFTIYLPSVQLQDIKPLMGE